MPGNKQAAAGIVPEKKNTVLHVGKLLGIETGNSILRIHTHTLMTWMVAHTSLSLYLSWEMTQDVV